MTQRSVRAGRHIAIVAGLATALCCASVLTARPAQAVTLDELQAKVDEAAKAYDDATQRVNELNAKADEQQAKIAEIQQQLPAQQEKASEAMRSQYKMQQNTPGLVSLLLSSSDFSDFLTTYQYIDAIQADNVQQADQLAKMQQELVGSQQQLEVAQAEATQEQQNAEQAMNQAQQALSDLNQQMIAQQKAEEESKAQADAQAAASAAAAQQQDQAAADQQAAQEEEQKAEQQPQQSNPNAEDGSEVESDGEWMFGSASAYSPSDNTGGNATASGELLTWDSVTVAVPISQRYLLGRTVQIRYNGKTVNAKVTDVGGFAAYGRALDLAPGVWKAFGFSSTGSWGVRNVQYRFL